jgi:hypothetical protein
MCQTKIYHFCTTIVELNASWLIRCSIYWTINNIRSKYQLMSWRHPTSLDVGPWYRGNQFIELYIHSPIVLPHLSPIHSSLYSLALLHPASIRRNTTSCVLAAPSPPTLLAHKSSTCRPCFFAPSRSKVTVLDLLLHRILYSFVLLSRALCSFTSNLTTIILLDLQIKMHLLILEFVALYIRGVQLVSLIFLSIDSPN